jgi:hypothetical protein
MMFCKQQRHNMSKHDDQVSLKDMLSHAREAIEMLGKSGREDLAGNRILH